MRHGPAIIIILALTCPAIATADTVVLKDGRVLKGRVIEQGDTVWLHQRLGSIPIKREEVVRIAKDGEKKKTTLPYDMVFLKDGTIVRGDVQISKDGADVLVGHGKQGQIKHPRADVERILWRDGREEGLGKGQSKALKEKVDRLVKSLGNKNPGIAAMARRELLALGVFAKSYLESLKGEDRARVKQVLDDLDRLEEIRKVIPRQLEVKIRNLPERLISHSPADRQAALRAAVLEGPNLCGQLLLKVVKSDPAPSLRAYAVSQLSSLRRYEELAQVLKIPDGPLRLAAAFALGDAGIYAGVPILIEALRLKDLQIRRAAVDKLREYTKQHFGFRPKAPPGEREAAVAKWNAWWRKEGSDWLKVNLKTAAPTLVGGKVSQEDAAEARRYWLQGSELVASANAIDVKKGISPAEEKKRRFTLERALRLLQKALELDPSLASARMTRAVVLYEEFGRYAAARAELNRILDRAKFDGGDPDAARKFAHYHLGRIAMRQKAWRKAAVRFSQALRYDADFVDGLMGQGDAYMAMAVNDGLEKPTPGEMKRRRQLFSDALRIYAAADKALDKDAAELLQMVKDLRKGPTKTITESQVIQSVRRSRKALAVKRGELYYRMARVQAARQLDREALKYYRDALRVDPKNERYKRAVTVWEGLVKGK